MRRTILAASVGLLAGSLAVLVLWLTGAPRYASDRTLPAVVRLDGWDHYADGEPAEDYAGIVDQLEKVERKMAAPLAGPLRLDKVTFDQAVAGLAEAAGVPILVKWQDFAADGEFRTRRITLWADAGQGSAADHLDGLLGTAHASSPVGPAWHVEGGAVVITSQQDEPPRLVVTRVYDVRDLMLEAARVSRQLAPAFAFSAAQIPPGSEQAAAKALVDLVNAVIELEPNRRRRGQGTAYWGGRLVVVQSPAAHRKVAAELARLRSHIKSPAPGGN